MTSQERYIHVHGSGLGPILQDSLEMRHFVVWIILDTVTCNSGDSNAHARKLMESCLSACAYVCVYACVCACVRACVCVCVCVCVDVWMCVCVHMDSVCMCTSK